MRSRLLTALSFCLVILAAGTANAQSSSEVAPYEIVPDGRQYEMRLSADTQHIKTVSVYFVSTGNISNGVTFEVRGPAGIVGAAKGGYIANRQAAAALQVKSLIRPYKVRHFQDKSEKTRFQTTSYGYSSAAGYAGGWFHIQKDACNKNKKARYVTQVKLDLRGIDPALYQGVFSISIAVRESPFTGAKVASVKPKSVGKYFGEPILLMGTVGYGSEYVNKVTWKNGRIVRQKRLPVVKYVGYMGYGLSLVRLKNDLQGGFHTWELSNGGQMYGVCLQAVRKRQRVNGYPGSGE